MQEQRKFPRRRTLLDGRVEIAKLSGWAVDCTVRNVSAGGAHLTIPRHVVVPQSFQMRISGAPATAARLVWYKDGQAGVALTEAEASPDEVALQARIRAIAGRSANTPTVGARLTRPAVRAGKPCIKNGLLALGA